MQQFSLPKARALPEDSSDIANDLKAYGSQQVEVEGQEVGASGSGSGSGAGGERATTEDDWFEDDEESEEVHAAAH